MIASIEEGRKQDGNRSIADKIIKRLHDLEKTVESNHGRWAWELLQNAKDSIADEDRTVDVMLILSDTSVQFFHNGTHFTENDVRGLINQISSKEVEEGEVSNKTGRFGTGFITTHLLSKVIQVSGVVKTQIGEFYTFNFPLDREGSTTAVLAPKIEATWGHFQSTVQKVYNYDKQQFNTCFTYPLQTEKQKNIAQKGVDEFSRLMPYVLAFNPKIGRVTIINNGHSVVYNRKSDILHDFILPISKIENNNETTLQIAVGTSNTKTIHVAAEIDPITNSVKPFTDVPRLFCDFPLVGTESFYFPVVVNSSRFFPHTERHSIWLKGNEDKEVVQNQDILETAVALYKKLLTKLSEFGTKNLYNVADTRIPDVNKEYFDSEWYKTLIREQLIDIIINTPIVDTHKHGRRALKETFIIYGSEKDMSHLETLWHFAEDFKIEPYILPERKSLNLWLEVAENTDCYGLINVGTIDLLFDNCLISNKLVNLRQK